MNAQIRTFDDRPAVRGPTPLLFGIAGPSGSGKTYSALRLATGIQLVVGGEIYLIDTESNRALHYAELFKFRHVPFAAPFAPSDYQAAIEHCVKKGARTIIVDSMSHEHEGPGGVLEMHEAEVNRLMKAWNCSGDKANIPAWNVPKSERRRLVIALSQATCNFVLCFRAKEKVKIQTGKEVKNLGFMPIAGDEFVYELTAKCLLLPGASGVPALNPEHDGEKMMAKIPEQFRNIFTGAKGKPIDEDLGEQLARWAAGDSGGNPAEDLAHEYANCLDKETFDGLEQRRAEIWKKLPAADKQIVKGASDAANARVSSAAAPATSGDLLGGN